MEGGISGACMFLWDIHLANIIIECFCMCTVYMSVFTLNAMFMDGEVRKW
jgi:hypothetical protein